METERQRETERRKREAEATERGLCTYTHKRIVMFFRYLLRVFFSKNVKRTHSSRPFQRKLKWLKVSMRGSFFVLVISSTNGQEIETTTTTMDREELIRKNSKENRKKKEGGKKGGWEEDLGRIEKEKKRYVESGGETRKEALYYPLS